MFKLLRREIKQVTSIYLLFIIYYLYLRKKTKEQLLSVTREFTVPWILDSISMKNIKTDYKMQIVYVELDTKLNSLC